MGCGTWILAFAVKNLFDPMGLVTGGISGLAIKRTLACATLDHQCGDQCSIVLIGHSNAGLEVRTKDIICHRNVDHWTCYFAKNRHSWG